MCGGWQVVDALGYYTLVTLKNNVALCIIGEGVK